MEVPELPSFNHIKVINLISNDYPMLKKSLSIFSVVFAAFFMAGCTKDTAPVQNQNINTNSVSAQNENINTNTAKVENKLCDWIDESDIIIKINFAEGVVKDTSYEAGFYYSTIGSTMRLARSGCDYRTGFSYEELKNAGAVQVGVRGFTDSNRRQIAGEPIGLILDANGKPDVGSYIEVTITD
jgi:outer membrane murein-binding lipoprotein Lpp